MSLALATAALDRGDDVGALAALLEAWREVPEPALAALVEQVGARCRGTPITGKTLGARDAEFARRLERRDPIDLPILLAHALTRRPSAVVPARLVGELASWPRDPRTTLPLLAALTTPAWDSATAHGLWDAIFAALAHHADPRAVAGLGELDVDAIWARRMFGQPHRVAIAGMHRRRKAWLANHARAIPATTPEVAALVERTRAPRSTRGLVDAVLEHPARVEARDVLRDALLEAGDPRGEHMALDAIARTRSLTPDEHARRAELARPWWPGLEEVAMMPVVRDGFLVACGLATDRAHLLAKTIGEPAWSTVERIELASWNLPLPLALFAHPIMRSLGALGAVAIETASSIWTPATTWLRTVEIGHLTPSWRAHLDRVDALPNLQRLETSQYYDRVPAYAWLWETALFQRVREFSVGLGNDSLGTWHRAVLGDAHAHLARIELGRYHLERDARGNLARLTVALPPTPREQPHAKTIAAALEELAPDTITHVRFVGRALDAKPRALLETALAAQPIERFVVF